MSISTNIVKARFNGGCSTYGDRTLHQRDRGQILTFPDLADQLPSAYQVWFANEPDQGSAVPQLGVPEGVSIPDTLIATGRPIWAWLYLQTGEDDAETCFTVVIFNKPQPSFTGATPTPAQATAWDDAVAALSAAAEEFAEAAEGIPTAIDTALQEAKDSGEFDGRDGTAIWYTYRMYRSYVPGDEPYYQYTARVAYLSGSEELTPAIGDYVFGPETGNGEPETPDALFAIESFVSATLVRLTYICNIKGETGPAGQDGADGADGADGYSPTVTVEEITGGHRVTITDAEHPDGQSFDVLDGSGGGGSVTVDDEISGSSTNPVQNKVIKAALDAKGTYSKPSGGIPKTDLASDVQTSLGKADTALQQHQSLSAYRTAEDQDVIDNTKGTYSKPSGGIPKTDLASDVQTSLGKADSALQQHQDISGKADKITEVTVSDAGAVTQALDAGKIYHFTGALTSLTITLNAASAGQLAQYHFDFDSGSTAPTVTLPGTVTMQGGTFSPEASKHYEIDILNNYGVSMAW